MKKYLPALIAAFLVGVTVNNAYADGSGDVDDVTMNVVDQNNPQDVTSNIQLPAQASPEAAEHVNGTADDDTQTDVDYKADQAEAQAEAQEEAHEDSHAAAEEQAHQAMQDATDASTSSHDN